MLFNRFMWHKMLLFGKVLDRKMTLGGVVEKYGREA